MKDKIKISEILHMAADEYLWDGDDIITYMNERKIQILDHHQQRQGEM